MVSVGRGTFKCKIVQETPVPFVLLEFVLLEIEYKYYVLST